MIKFQYWNRDISESLPHSQAFHWYPDQRVGQVMSGKPGIEAIRIARCQPRVRFAKMAESYFDEFLPLKGVTRVVWSQFGFAVRNGKILESD